jgi:hypothetical protein
MNEGLWKEDGGRRDSSDDERFFRQSSTALKMWCRKFNTAEIANHLGVHEAIVCRWIRYWREMSRERMS